MSKAENLPSTYVDIHSDIVTLLENARRAAARSVNALMTASYWEIGRRIVEFEQGGEGRAAYGEALIQRLALDLTHRFGRGFSYRNLSQMRAFYLAWPLEQICQTASGVSPGNSQTVSAQSCVPSILQTLSAESNSTPNIQITSGQLLMLSSLAVAFPLPWSAYVRLLSVKKPEARGFYEAEALRCGWTVRQLDRQINSQFYERTALSKNKVAMLAQAEHAEPDDAITPEQAIKDPFVLEFLNLKDQYSESDLEDALIQHLADFLLELGDDFAFVGRQRRLRLDDTWFRIDLLFFHRRLKCLVVIDLKNRQIQLCRCRADASLPELRPRTLDEAWQEPAGGQIEGLRRLQGIWRKPGILCATFGLGNKSPQRWKPFRLASSGFGGLNSYSILIKIIASVTADYQHSS